MNPLRTVGELCVKLGITVEELAARAGLDARRVRAIAEGRWTPSPQERDRVAAVFGLTRDDIAWGHRAQVDHMYGHGPQFGRSP
jgi:transcriptional regulator with XRE-family HTH domain